MPYYVLPNSDEMAIGLSSAMVCFRLAFKITEMVPANTCLGNCSIGFVRGRQISV